MCGAILCFHYFFFAHVFCSINYIITRFSFSIPWQAIPPRGWCQRQHTLTAHAVVPQAENIVLDSTGHVRITDFGCVPYRAAIGAMRVCTYQSTALELCPSLLWGTFSLLLLLLFVRCALVQQASQAKHEVSLGPSRRPGQPEGKNGLPGSALSGLSV